MVSEVTVEPGGSVAAGLLRSARPRQWIKNLLVLAAPAAAGLLGDGTVLWRVGLAFVAFCAVASGVYLINDVHDAEADRAHPVKRRRPVAVGVVAPAQALALAGALFAGGLALALVLRPLAAVLLGVYVALQLAYSWGLKHVEVVDLLSIASGFVLRAGVGAAVAEVPVSSWFLTVTAFGALMMAAGKRSSELRRAGADAGTSRRVLAGYSTEYLHQVQTIAVGGALLGYALWAFEQAALQRPSGWWLELSVVPFAAALLRYLLIMNRGEAEAPEEAIFSDIVLAVMGLAWAVAFVLGVESLQ
jgi:decaprenyl-phosphate phosphoribosyltransferase